MGIRLLRFPEYRLNLNIYSGAISAVDLIQHQGRLDSAADWLSYFDATADLSGIDLADFPALKHAITAKEYERGEDEPRRHALVNVPDANALFVSFWRHYASAGVRNAHQREIFATLEAACRWLDLPHAAPPAIAEAIADGKRPASQEASQKAQRSRTFPRFHRAAPAIRAPKALRAP